MGDTKSEAGKRYVVLPAFLHLELRRHLDWYAEKGPEGLLFVGEQGAPFRRSSFGRKWRKARRTVGMPDSFRFYDLRHTGHALATRSGATLKDTMVRAGQASEKAALIYQHPDHERQKEVASGLDKMSEPLGGRVLNSGKTVKVVRRWCATLKGRSRRTPSWPCALFPLRGASRPWADPGPTPTTAPSLRRCAGRGAVGIWVPGKFLIL